MHLIDADELIRRMIAIRDKPYDGIRTMRKASKYNLSAHNRDRMTADIAIIKRMIEESNASRVD